MELMLSDFFYKCRELRMRRNTYHKILQCQIHITSNKAFFMITEH